jgi:hypothetical protein
VLEDLTTQFDAPLAHMAQVRRWLEYVLNVDLKHYTAEQCALRQFNTVATPLFCTQQQLKM